MRIDEIILEYKMGTAIDLETLQAEFDEQYGNPRLPQHINLSKSQIVALAMGIAQKTRETPGTAIRKATVQLYPKHDIDADVYIGSPKRKSPSDKKDKEEPKKAVVVKKDDGVGRGKYTKHKDGSDRKSAPAPSYDFKPDKGDGTGTGAKIAKAINPLSDLDTTDFGTVATSAARKARSKMKNLGSFIRQPTQKR